jgi:uncharacterized OsmC-like protein
MTQIHLRYHSPLKVECIHESGAHIATAGPKEFGGKGDLFSPTDLFATSLATCMMTVMAIQAIKLGIDLEGTQVFVEKEMATTPPRRISRMVVHFQSSFIPPSSAVRKKLERAAIECPVHHSLHPDLKLEVDFKWGGA